MRVEKDGCKQGGDPEPIQKDRRGTMPCRRLAKLTEFFLAEHFLKNAFFGGLGQGGEETRDSLAPFPFSDDLKFPGEEHVSGLYAMQLPTGLLRQGIGVEETYPGEED